MEKLLQKYGIEKRLPSFEALYESALAEYRAHGAEILDYKKFPVFTHMAEDVERIKNALSEDEDNILYCYFLNAAVRAGDKEAMQALSSPKAEEKSDVYDSISMFALLYELPKTVAEHKRRGVPEDVTLDTLEMFQNQMGDYRLLNGRIGLSCYMSWMLMFVNCTIIRVGRFNLEMRKFGKTFCVFRNGDELLPLANGVTVHSSGQILGSAGCEDESGAFLAEIRESDECFEGYPALCGKVSNTAVKLSKSEWKPFLSEGDLVISVHIPTGGPMTPEVCDADLRRGQEIIEKCFSEVKAFYCSSWLLSTEIESVTGKRGNVVKFGDMFTRYPVKNSAKDVLTYVFDCKADTPLENLPEKNSFAKSIKNHLLSGGKIYEYAGVFTKF